MPQGGPPKPMPEPCGSVSAFVEYYPNASENVPLICNYQYIDG